MEWLKIIIDACASIWFYSLDLCGYNIKLVNIFVWGVLCYLCFKIINFFT